MLDFSEFLVPVSEDAPCGVDCEYDAEFLALTQEAAGKPEQQYGDTVIPAVEPDWRKVDKMSRELLKRTRDLRVGALLALANTHLYGPVGFAAGLRLCLEWCKRYWEEVYPRLEVDGEVDPYVRSNALVAFAGSEFGGEDRLLQALRASALLPPPLAASYRDVETVFTRPQDAKFAVNQVEAALADALAAGSEAVLAVLQADEAAHELVEFLAQQLASEDRPDLDRLLKTLRPVAEAIRRVQAQPSPQASEGEEVRVAASAPPSAGLSLAVISSREDARR
ncbi:MAG: type VI secretion system ImpA family N-terminal domain-containing protein, partial [Casimicrobiaceae bacterium]|nr:type VI secretion system ImpA family N-terminal domain-containing protein [Casimicrobiaceae bacterium]